MPLWRKYWERKKEVERDFPGDEPNRAKEAYWFHGAAPPVIHEIIKTGFDLRVSNQGIMGAGIYFASRSSYSLAYSSQPAHSAEDRAGVSRLAPPPRPRGKKGSSGSHHAALAAALAAQAAAAAQLARHSASQRAHGELLMLHCRVIEGKVGKGSQAQRRPEAGCHSAITPDVSPHRLICVFDNHQCYPECARSARPIARVQSALAARPARARAPRAAAHARPRLVPRPRRRYCIHFTAKP